MRVALDADGIHDADFVAIFLQMDGEPLPQAAGGFHAGVHRSDLEPLQPANELFPAGQSVVEGAAMLLFVSNEERIKLVFGDIHAENRFCHSNVFIGRCQTVGNSSRKPLL